MKRGGESDNNDEQQKRQSGGGKTTTTCDKCGETHVIYPPSPDYPNMLLQACPQRDSLERVFECKKCGQLNKDIGIGYIHRRVGEALLRRRRRRRLLL